MRTKYTRYIALNGIIAAIYAALTISTAWASYGPIQFRAAELLNLLAFFDAAFAPGVAVGCLVANIISQFGLIDVVFGTLATICALIAITLVKNFYIASTMPVIANGAIIPLVIIQGGGLPLTWYNYWINAAEVAAGEFAVCVVVGAIVYRLALCDENGVLRRALKRMRQ